MEGTSSKKPFLQRPAAIIPLACLAALLWGTAFPVVKVGYALFSAASTADRLAFAGIRFLGAGLAVILIGSCTRRKPLLPGKQAARRVVLLAFVQTVLQYLFFYYAMANTTGAKGSILNSTSAFLGVILAHFFTRDERMTTNKAAGCLLGLAGVAAVNLGPMGNFSPAGDGAMLLASLSEAGAGLVSKWATEKAEPVTAAGWQLFLGGGTLWATGILFGGKLRAVSPSAWVLLAYLMALSAVSYSVWTLLLKWNPVAKISMFLSMVPIFGIISSGILLREPVFRIRNLAGAALVSAGICLVNRVQSSPIPSVKHCLHQRGTRCKACGHNPES